jgi:tetratricopeptide (TPR) repeat protein
MANSRRQPDYANILIIVFAGSVQTRTYVLPFNNGKQINNFYRSLKTDETDTTMTYITNKGVTCLFLLIALSASGTVFADTQTIKQLLEEGNSEAAYQHALTLSAENEGDPEFDFLLGMAALKSGHLPEAVFALERVVIAEPENHRARLELARVYYLQKDYQNAKTEFLAVRAQHPPANVRKKIDAYLSAIDKGMNALTGAMSARLSMSFGYDSNINSSTDNETVNVPALGTVILNQSSREISDQFSEIIIGGTAQHQLSRQSSFLTQANLNIHNNLHHDEFDTNTANIRLAYQLTKPDHSWQLPLYLQQINVDGNSFRRMASIGTEYSMPKNNHILSVGVQVGGFKYPDYEERDANFAIGSLGWRTALGSGHGIVSGGINLGYEDPKLTSGANFGRRYGGLQFAWQRTKNNKNLYASAYYQYAEYTETDTVFLTTRRDQFYQLAVGHTWILNRHWALDVALQDTVNNSNIALYSYDRVLAKGGLSYVY